MGRKRGRDEAKERLWRERMEERAASGLNVRARCRREGVRESAFYSWRGELARRDREGERVDLREEHTQRAPQFVRVVPSEVAGPTAGAGRIEIRTRGGHAVVVERGFDPETLGAVIDVLERHVARC